MSFRKQYDMSPRRDKGESKLRMDRSRITTRITDPSLPAGKRKEIDNVMRKARAGGQDNEVWNKKLLEVEKRDPNRWRHTGYKKLYIEGRDSSDSEPERDRGKILNSRRSRSRSVSRSRNVNRRSPSPVGRKISPPGYKYMNRRSRSRSNSRRRTPHSPTYLNRRPPPLEPINRRRSPPPSRVPPPSRAPPPQHFSNQRRISPIGHQTLPARRVRSPLPSVRMMASKPKRPSPQLTRPTRSPSSCSDNSCSVCSDHQDRRQIPARARASSKPRVARPRSPPALPTRKKLEAPPSTSLYRPASPEPHKHAKQRKHDKSHLVYEKETPTITNDSDGSIKTTKKKPKKRVQTVESNRKSKKSKVRARIKIEGEKSSQRPRSPSSDSSSSSSETISTITATTRLTLSERFGKIAQWSVENRSNMENMNMRITKNSGGELKVMIGEEEDMNPPRRYNRPEEFENSSLSHLYPEEVQCPTGFSVGSWENIKVRFDYYKSRGYLRDLDLQDYIKWEEWWYKYQEWLKQERFYEMWESRMAMRRRGRKKVPIQNRLN